jgi:predicted solute-binding protein
MNAAPLSRRLRDVDPGIEVVSAVPSSLPAMLVKGEVDAALIPVAALLAQESLERLTDLGICADGPARSVLLKCRKPLAEVKEVAMDPASVTSNTLARVLLKKHFQSQAEVKQCDSPELADARIVIGDQAFEEEPGASGDYDLADEWGKMTGLPFVFAAWACRKDYGPRDELAQILTRAYEVGAADVDSLAGECAEELGFEYELCRTYLADVIKYRIGAREQEAIELFGSMAGEL